MSEQIIAVFDAICEKFGMAIDWTQQNIIPYIEQLSQRIVNYEIGTSIAWIVIALIVICTTIILYVRWTKSNFDWDEGAKPYILTTMTILSVFSSAILIVQTFDIVTCLTLPEKVILEFANNLLR